jgi:hypothetical protein
MKDLHLFYARSLHKTFHGLEYFLHLQFDRDTVPSKSKKGSVSSAHAAFPTPNIFWVRERRVVVSCGRIHLKTAHGETPFLLRKGSFRFDFQRRSSYQRSGGAEF